MSKFSKYSIILMSALILTACMKSDEKQQVAEIKISDVKSSKKTESSSSSQVEEIEDEETEDVEEIQDSSVDNNTDSSSSESTDQVTNVETETTSVVGTIHDRVQQIQLLVTKLHDFAHPSQSEFDKLEKEFTTHGVGIDPSIKGPFGLFDSGNGQPPSLVMTSIVINKTIEKTDTGYIIRVSSRVGTSPLVDSLSHTSQAIRKEIRQEKHASSQKDSEYHLNVSEDGMSATLVRVTDQWW